MASNDLPIIEYPVGTLVYYIERRKKFYARVHRIEGSRVWGNWQARSNTIPPTSEGPSLHCGIHLVFCDDPNYLRQPRQGKVWIVMRNGEPVPQLTPPQDGDEVIAIKDWIE